jgi:acyl-CoA synthetase (AMP-forming)/AMP-acid ligase II
LQIDMTKAPCTLPELLERAVEAWSGRTALISEDERWTYAELAERVERMSRGLVGMGVGKGSHVGLLMENGMDWVPFAFAATSVGALFIPISTFSKQDDLAYQLRHADVSHLFMSARFLKNDYLEMLRKTAPEFEAGTPGALLCEALPALRRVVVRGADDALPAGCEPWSALDEAAEGVPASIVRGLRADVDREDDCYLLYTSGTTARPKGVLHVHDAVARNGWLIGEYQMLDENDVAWFYFPMFFSAGCINVMLGTLSHGASMVVQPSFDAGQAIALIEREKANTWHLWAHTLKSLTSHPDWQEKDHSLLHKGTAPFDAMIGPHPDGLGGVNMYGMTETCTAFSCTPADAPLKDRITSTGPLMPDAELKIVDPDTRAPLAVGEEGEICVKGPAVLRRYYKVDPAETFDADGFFATGDLGKIDADGNVHFNQRIKDMIKTGGINVSPADIEMKLVAMEGVDVAHAFPLPAGDRGEVVGAALVVRAENAPDDAAIEAYFGEALPGYKRPEGVLLLRADQVPMTGSGKVQKVVMRDRLIAALDAGDGPIVRSL